MITICHSDRREESLSEQFRKCRLVGSKGDKEMLRCAQHDSFTKGALRCFTLFSMTVLAKSHGDDSLRSK